MDQQRVDWINQFLSSEYIGEFIHLLSVEELNRLFEQLRQYNHYLSSLAHKDALTQLPNRHYFDLASKQLLAQIKRRKQKAALLYLDLDGFKQINDINGHATGDLILCEVANILRYQLREEDLVARIGGDEFVIVMPCIHAYTDAGALGRKLIDSINTVKSKFLLSTDLSCSIGIAGYPIAGETIDELISKADSALYRVKNRGGSQIEYHSDQVNNEYKYREKVYRSLQKITSNKKVSLAYMPVYQVNDNKINGLVVNISESSPNWLLVRIKDLLDLSYDDAALADDLSVSYLVEIYNEFKIYNQMKVDGQRNAVIFIEVSRQMIFNNRFQELFKSFIEHSECFKTGIVLSFLVQEIDQNLLLEIKNLKKVGIQICFIYIENDDFDMTIYNDICPDYINLSMEGSFLSKMNVVLVKSSILFFKSMGIKIIFSDVNTDLNFKKAHEIEPDLLCGNQLSIPLSQSELIANL